MSEEADKKRDANSCDDWKNAQSGDCVFVRWGALKELGDEWLAGAEVAGVRDNGLLLYRPSGDLDLHSHRALKDEVRRLKNVSIDLTASSMACSGFLIQKGVCTEGEFTAARSAAESVIKAALSDLGVK
jgi:hypothetical protein